MALPGFIFGGDTGVTPERLKRDRAVAEALLAGSARGRAPQNVGEGLNAIGQALMFRVADGRARKGEKVQSEKQADIWSKLGGAMGSGGAGAGFSTATGPITSASPAPSGTASIPTGERASYIRSGLVQRGLPEHVADGFLANFQDESGLDPGINERNPVVPGSRGGFGLYQLTGPRRREYEAFASKRGVDPSDMDAQMDFMMGELQGSERAAAERIFAAKDTAGAAQAIVTNFLRPAAEHRNARVAKYAGLGGGMQAQAQPVQVASLDPSAGMASAPEPDVRGTVPYTGPALNDPNPAISIAPTGMPGASPEMDAQIERFHAGNGSMPTQYGQGAPRAPLPGAVVGDAREMRAGGPQAKDAAVAQAMGMTGQGARPPGMSPVASALAGQPPQARPVTPPQPGVDPWTGMRAQDIAQASGALQMAQAAPSQGGGMDMQALVGIMSDPWASDEQREVAKFIYQDQMQRTQSAQERAYEAAVLRDQRAYDDGVRREGFAREDGRNAIEDRREDARFGLDRAKFEREGRKPIEVGGVLVDPQTMQPVYTAPQKPTTNMQDYDAYAADEVAAGRQPIGRLEYEQAVRKAGSNSTTISTGQDEGEFQKKAAGRMVERFGVLADGGSAAANVLQTLPQMRELLAVAPQGPIQGRLAEMFPGFSTAADAFTATVNQIAPSLRIPGSGAQSDKDMDILLGSFPRMRNDPQANILIMDAFQTKAQINLQRAEIATAALRGELSPAEADRRIAELDRTSIIPEGMRDRLGVTQAPDTGMSTNPTNRPRATNPQTGEVIEFDGTQWVPAQ